MWDLAAGSDQADGMWHRWWPACSLTPGTLFFAPLGHVMHTNRLSLPLTGSNALIPGNVKKCESPRSGFTVRGSFVVIPFWLWRLILVSKAVLLIFVFVLFCGWAPTCISCRTKVLASQSPALESLATRIGLCFPWGKFSATSDWCLPGGRGFWGNGSSLAGQQNHWEAQGFWVNSSGVGLGIGLFFY